MSGPFVLGTAQLGFDYGVANRGGQPAYETAREIVDTAWQLGIRQFDTARSYGDSEKILGRVFEELGGGGEVEVHTKWNLGDVADAKAVENLFAETLERLRLGSLDTLYAHDFESYAAAPDEVKQAIGERISAGRLKYFAVSVYDPEEAFAAIDDDLVSAIQIPGNAFDRRFEKAGFIAAAKQRGVRVFVRSLYLQGLLVMAPEQIPERLSFARDAVSTWHAFCADHGVPPEAMALQYAKFKGWGTAVIGCESSQQVQSNVAMMEAVDADVEEVARDWEGDKAPTIENTVVDPRFWPAS